VSQSIVTPTSELLLLLQSQCSGLFAESAAENVLSNERTNEIVCLRFVEEVSDDARPCEFCHP
jgi:hypothetical protein